MSRRAAYWSLLILAGLLLGALWRWCPAAKPDSTAPLTLDAGSLRSAPTAANADRGDVGSLGSSQAPAWFFIEHAQPRRIGGVVVGGDGNPIAGATVELGSALTSLTKGNPETRASDAAGRFDFGEKRPAVYRVAARAPGHALTYVTVDLSNPSARPASDQLVLRVESCEAGLFGRVLDAAGGPIVGARVSLEGVVGVDAQADGTFELCLASQPTTVFIKADGYGGVALSFSGKGRTHRDVVLVPEAAIVGRVIRTDDGRPVEGAIVSAEAREWGRDRGLANATLSREDGTFRIDGVTPGAYRVYASTEGLSVPKDTEVLVAAGETAANIVLTLETGARVEGRLLAGGAPVAGARLRAFLSQYRPSQAAYSQEDGTFVLRGVPVGQIALQVEGWKVVAPSTLSVPSPAPIRDVVVEVEKQASITGIVSRHGSPIAGAQVRLGRVGVRQTDEDGRYEFTGLLAGEYELSCNSARAGAFGKARPVRVSEGERRDHVDIDLEFGAQVSGLLVDQDATPVAGARIRLVLPATGDQCSTLTDADGSWSCKALTGGGAYLPSVFASEGSPIQLWPPPGQPLPTISVAGPESVVAGIRLTVRAKQEHLAGRVVDGAGSPLVDVHVRVVGVDPGGTASFPSWSPLPETVTDLDGGFVFMGLAPGEYALQARASDGAEAVASHVDVPGRDVTVTLTPSGQIEGRLVGFRQEPVLYAHAVEGGRFVRGQVDGERFRFTGLRAGSYRVTAQSREEGDAKLVEVAPGQSTALTLTSRGSGIIRVTVRDFDTQQPIAGMLCRAVMRVQDAIGIADIDPGQLPRSNPQGQLVIDPAPAGDVVVDCRSPGARQSGARARATVPPNGAVDVALNAVTRSSEAPTGNVGFTLDWNLLVPRVASVGRGGPAERAGLLPGDVILAVNGRSVAPLTVEGVVYLLLQAQPGGILQVDVSRGAQVLRLGIEVAPLG